MNKFISCDWGTSTFRLRLVDATSKMVLSEVVSSQGIAETHSRWTQEGLSEENRFSFYRAIMDDQVTRLQKQINISLHGLPLFISGMASSNMGILELPYKKVPFATDGSDFEIRWIRATSDFQHDVMMISGARTNADIMRGEETQLIGCRSHQDDDHIYIFPGTHSKHVIVQDKKVIDFKTYMTGEFFHLLCHASILSKSVIESTGILTSVWLTSFEEGVMQSRHGNLLHQTFLVRTRHVLNHTSKEQNFYYLSGLLIGTELHDVAHGNIPVTVVATEVMSPYYRTALHKLGVNNVQVYDADVALVNGHCIMHERFYDR